MVEKIINILVPLEFKRASTHVGISPRATNCRPYFVAELSHFGCGVEVHVPHVIFHAADLGPVLFPIGQKLRVLREFVRQPGCLHWNLDVLTQHILGVHHQRCKVAIERAHYLAGVAVAAKGILQHRQKASPVWILIGWLHALIKRISHLGLDPIEVHLREPGCPRIAVEYRHAISRVHHRSRSDHGDVAKANEWSFDLRDANGWNRDAAHAVGVQQVFIGHVVYCNQIPLWLAVCNGELQAVICLSEHVILPGQVRHSIAAQLERVCRPLGSL